MKKILFVLAALPCFCFSLQQSKEPSLRIETLHPDGTKTVRQMVPDSQVKTERLAPKVPAQSLHTSELAEARRAANTGHVLTEKQRYLAKIIAKIQQNWVVDDTMRGKECRLNMKLAPDGSLTQITVLEGDYNLCLSAIAAIKKAGKFPMSSDPVIYDALRDLTTILRPEPR